MSPYQGRAIVRSHSGVIATDTLDVAALASVEVSSENELYPIDNAFDGRNGAGGSCWVAGKPGAQVVHLRFRAPTEIRSVIVESEECELTSSQQIEISGWIDDRWGPFASPPRVLQYSPYGASFHRETWDISEASVTEILLHVTPAPIARLASLTAIILR